MNLFITWSGDTSKAIALALRNWIPMVIQSIEPFMSEKDIERGAPWETVLSKKLDDSLAGIACLTPDNLTSPWLLYEAGAISKSVRPDESRVFTYLHKLTPAQVEPPLGRFQHTLANKEGTRRLMFDLRKLGNANLTDDGLGKLFETMWPDLEKEIVQAPPHQQATHRDPREMIEETLNSVRAIERQMQSLFSSSFDLVPGPGPLRIQLSQATGDTPPGVHGPPSPLAQTAAAANWPGGHYKSRAHVTPPGTTGPRGPGDPPPGVEK